MRDEFESLKRMFIDRAELNFQQFEQLTRVLMEIPPFDNSLKIEMKIMFTYKLYFNFSL